MTPPTVDIVVPVYNEEGGLAPSVRRLHEFLSSPEFPLTWRVVIANNASSDSTLAVADALAEDLPGIEVLDVPGKGRGRALRAAWSQSDAEVVAYMDVDLSTDLRALLPLVAPLVSGHSEVAIGSRLTRGARVHRGAKREFISRTYNRVLRGFLRVGFSDAQCGFKAARTDAVQKLLPSIRDESWFFDTELLVAAERAQMRIHEVPVDWVDDSDSRVQILPTVVEDLRGVARLMASSQVVRFLAIGVASTLAYALLFVLLRSWMPAALANGLALALTAVANTAANRRFTFRVRGREWLLRHHALGGLVFVLTLGLTTGALAVLHALAAHPSRLLEAVVLVVASACATVTRYVGLRLVFARRRHQSWLAGQALPANAQQR
jgi:glycosyltransferase involved in cell wall biosynthesis